MTVGEFKRMIETVPDDYTLVIDDLAYSGFLQIYECWKSAPGKYFAISGIASEPAKGTDNAKQS